MDAKQQVVIYDKEDNRYMRDEDGRKNVFENEIAAKNYLFSLGYKYSFVQEKIVFEPYIQDYIK